MQGLRRFFQFTTGSAGGNLAALFTLLTPSTPNLPVALDFAGTGTDEYLKNVGGDVTLGITNAWTIAVWIKYRRATTGGQGTALAIRPADQSTTNSIDMVALDTLEDAQFRLRARNSSGFTMEFAEWGAYNAGVWTHLVVTWDGADLTVYQNGIEDTAPSITNGSGAQTDTSRTIWMMINPAESATVDAVLFSEAIWNSVLTGTEIGVIYSNGDAHAFDLTSDSGSYTSSLDLEHLWQFNIDPSDIGADHGTGTTIDMLNGAGISSDDFIADTPIKRSLDLSGTTEYMQSAAATLGIADAWTVGGWVNQDQLAVASGLTHDFIELKETAGNNNRLLIQQLDSTGDKYRVRFYDSSATLTDLVFTTAPATGWRHIAVTWDGVTLRPYVNGSADATTATPAGAQTDSSREVAIGADNAGADELDGKTHGWAIWSSALGATEITDIDAGNAGYNLRKDEGNYASKADLQHWWPFSNPTDIGEDLGLGTAIDVAAAAVGVTVANQDADVPS